MTLRFLKSSLSASHLNVVTFDGQAPMFVLLDIMRHPEVCLSIPSYKCRYVPTDAPLPECTTPFCTNRVNKMWQDASSVFYKNFSAINDMNDPPSESFITALSGNFVDIPFVMTSGSWVTVCERMSESCVPEVRKMATQIIDLLVKNTPKKLEEGGWHLPYVCAADVDPVLNSLKSLLLKLNLDMSPEAFEASIISTLIKISVARCAVYEWYIGDTPDAQVEHDLNNFSILTEGKTITYKDHFLHQLQPDVAVMVENKHIWRNHALHNKVDGWISYSKVISWELWTKSDVGSPPLQSELVEVNGCSQVEQKEVAGTC